MDTATATHMTIRSDQVSSGATSVSRPTRDINSELNIINSFLAKNEESPCFKNFLVHIAIAMYSF